MGKIIGISGSGPQSGKDTVGKIIQYYSSNLSIPIDEFLKEYNYNVWMAEEQSGWEIKQFSTKLKEMASMITGEPFSVWYDGKLKQEELPEWGMTRREFLQKLGTDAVRDNLHSDTWVKALMVDFRPFYRQGEYEMEEKEPKWIITDVRFPNEYAAIKEQGGVMIYVNKVVEEISHSSENSLKDHTFDHIIDNNGSLVDLQDKVSNILKFL